MTVGSTEYYFGHAVILSGADIFGKITVQSDANGVNIKITFVETQVLK